ncbi:hypothetical protein K456DRAFT_1741968 [Colletotrichum gloeosporioides 23]|nr:hypothetical protein K456DRAFT_1741968 [Colletotrichum gloeosporioides 23]
MAGRAEDEMKKDISSQLPRELAIVNDTSVGDVTMNVTATGGHSLRNDVSRMEAIAATLRPRPLPVIPPASTVETTPAEGPRLAVFDYFGSTMVDFIVGPQGRKISIHANILLANPDCACFRETLQRQKNGHGAKKLRLMDHPDVVGLMTQFLYTGKVPFIPRRLLQKHCAPAARHPITMLSHTCVKNDSVRVGNVTPAAVSPEKFQTMPWSISTSAEEIRLRDYGNYELQMSQKSAAATAPTADNAEGRSQTVRYWRECVQLHLQNVEKIPVFGMSIVRVEAELYQLKLVQLMLFADRYNMAWLFHDTLASYCKGEALFQRDRPVERHVELAYRCATFRLLPELMVEYGRFCAWRRDSDIDIMFGGYLPDFVADVKLKKTEGNPIPPIIGRFLRAQI